VVNAYFLMRNQGMVDESMKAVFPSRSGPACRGVLQGDSFTYYSILQDSFQVSVDAVDVPTSTLEAPYGDCPDYPWMAFDVTFPVHEDVLVKVSYVMETEKVDFAQNIYYILETGAGWKGDIDQGDIILKYPYAVTSENILSSSTQGYQILYNEIFWSFQDLEPTSEDNIQISIVSPDVWLAIRKLRDQIAKLPESPEAWLNLINIYSGIAFSNKGLFIRDEHYFNLIDSTYEKAVAVNPNSAELFARYAAHKLFGWSPHGEPITEDQARQVLPLLSKALALESKNETALFVLSRLNQAAPFVTFTPPPTIPPTATSLLTATPSITLPATIQPASSATSLIVTVVQTKLVPAPTFTALPQPTQTTLPTKTEIQVQPQSESNPTSMIFGALVIFAAGAGTGWFLSRRQKK
jgi:hypothetical protein